MTYVFVFTKASAPHLVDLGSCLPWPEWRSEPIGYLRGFEAEFDLNDHEMLVKEMAAIGLKLKFMARSVSARNGCVGSLLSYAVEVARYEDAEMLPGFVPLGHWTGSHYMRPADPGKIICKSPDDIFEGMALKRVSVSDHYEEFETPPYTDDGAFVISRVPMGQLGEFVFLREDPLHFYATDAGETPEDVVARVRRFLLGLR